MVYFGFTHCPDICPEEMEKMSAAVNVISGQKDMPDIPIYFITCDPARDTPDVMKRYNEEISSRIIGLTGPEDKVLDACKQYRVYFSNGPKDRDGDYIVDHSVITYLMDPQGKCQAFYSRDSTVESVARDIRQKITSWVPQS
ncbi:protein SCO2 homolog, mitochondrial-like [Lingula anatina]|uniref:Protein SCO2 homolog, mitochondrial-like n=1 Tax=Lingula anatina TaxID=7574 RepID=A0A1S3IXE5_LINAN|nr:protein SCO2 homolog, mitochondrial-like [Lingula anatina]|eukprot:XP_013402877.1 protein SCO2 homolog, mitochondrial-like [Lingula anatina]